MLYEMVIRIAHLDMLSSQEDFMVTMASQWRPMLKAVDQILGKAREVTVSETQLMILKSSSDRLVSIAQSVE